MSKEQDLQHKFSIQFTLKQKNIFKEIARIFCETSDKELKQIIELANNLEGKMKVCPNYKKNEESKNIILSFLDLIDKIRVELKSFDERMEEMYNILKGIYDYTISSDENKAGKKGGEDIAYNIKEEEENNIIQKALNNTLTQEDYNKIQKALINTNNNPEKWSNNFEHTNNLLKQFQKISDNMLQQQQQPHQGQYTVDAQYKK